MKNMLLFFLLGLITLSAWADPINIVAAENVYGDVAAQLGKPYVKVTSIISSSAQDPHLFSVSPKAAILFDQADIIIENGMGYDTWAQRLCDTSHTKALLINVGELMHKKSGDNPHLWYSPNTMPMVSKIVVKYFIEKDPEHKAVYEKNLKNFLNKSQKYQQKIITLKEKVSGMKVTATEPVATYLLEALGLIILNEKFQQDMMNEVDLTPHEIIFFEESLKQKKQIQLFIYNKQVTSSMTEHLKDLALQNHIPVVGVNETLPSNQHYYQWMNNTLNKIEKALL